MASALPALKQSRQQCPGTVRFGQLILDYRFDRLKIISDSQCNMSEDFYRQPVVGKEIYEFVSPDIQRPAGSHMFGLVFV